MATKDQHIDVLCDLCVQYLDEIKTLSAEGRDKDIFIDRLLNCIAGFSIESRSQWDAEREKRFSASTRQECRHDDCRTGGDLCDWICNDCGAHIDCGNAVQSGRAIEEYDDDWA